MLVPHFKAFLSISEPQLLPHGVKQSSSEGKLVIKRHLDTISLCSWLNVVFCVWMWSAMPLTQRTT